MKRLDLTGQRFGRLIALYPTQKACNGNMKWLCQCDCGRTANVDGYALRHGNTRSCGCLRREKTSRRIRQQPGTVAHMGDSASLGIHGHVNLKAMTKIGIRNRSGVIGVSFNKRTKRWNARLFMAGTLLLNQEFVEFEDAVQARLAAERKYLSPFIAKRRVD